MIKKLNKMVTLSETIVLWYYLPTASGFRYVMLSQFNDNACEGKYHLPVSQGTRTIKTFKEYGQHCCTTLITNYKKQTPSIKLILSQWGGLSNLEVSTKCVSEESSTEHRTYNHQVQRIFSTVMSRPESMLIRL